MSHPAPFRMVTPLAPPPVAQAPESAPRYVVVAVHPDTGAPLQDAGHFLPYMVFGAACCGGRGITREEVAAGVRDYFGARVVVMLTGDVARWPSLVRSSWVALEVGR